MTTVAGTLLSTSVGRRPSLGLAGKPWMQVWITTADTLLSMFVKKLFSLGLTGKPLVKRTMQTPRFP